jgi:hypothetical protein
VVNWTVQFGPARKQIALHSGLRSMYSFYLRYRTLFPYKPDPMSSFLRLTLRSRIQNLYLFWGPQKFLGASEAGKKNDYNSTIFSAKDKTSYTINMQCWMSFFCRVSLKKSNIVNEFLEYWNTKKVFGGFDNIFYVYSVGLLYEGIPKIWKKLNSQGGFLRAD